MPLILADQNMELGMTRNSLIAMTFAAMLTSVSAHAQSTPQPAPTVAPPKPGFSDRDAEALRRDIQSSLKAAVAQNLKLTADEATRFWPVYEQYAAEIIAVKAAQKTLIQEYAVQFGGYDDKAATQFIKRWLEVDLKLAELRVSAIPRFNKVLPGVKAATFFQIERTLTAAIDLQISSQIPLLQSQTDRPVN